MTEYDKRQDNPGAPPKPVKRRPHQQIYATEEEFSHLKEKAEAAGFTSVNRWIIETHCKDMKGGFTW